MLEKVINKVPKTWWFSRPFGKNGKKCCRYHCRLHLTNDQDQQEGKMWSGVQDLHIKDSSQPAQPQITAPAPPLHNKYEKRCPCEVRIRRGKGLRSTVHLFSWTLKLVWRWETTLCDTEHYCYCRCPLHYIFSILCRFPKRRSKLLLRHLRKTLAIGNWFLTNGALSFKRVSWSRWWKGMPICLLQHSVYRYKQMACKCNIRKF